jgi:hypothetical protein
MFCATAAIITIFFTLSGLSIAIQGLMTVPSLCLNHVILLESTRVVVSILLKLSLHLVIGH